MTLAVNKTLEISQVGSPSVVNKQINEFPIRRRDINDKSRNLVNVGGFFSADRTSRYPFSAVLRNFQKSAVRLLCVISAYSADFWT